MGYKHSDQNKGLDVDVELLEKTTEACIVCQASIYADNLTVVNIAGQIIPISVHYELVCESQNNDHCPLANFVDEDITLG